MISHSGQVPRAFTGVYPTGVILRAVLHDTVHLRFPAARRISAYVPGLHSVSIGVKACKRGKGAEILQVVEEKKDQQPSE
jgi:hypothetical protein